MEAECPYRKESRCEQLHSQPEDEVDARRSQARRGMGGDPRAIVASDGNLLGGTKVSRKHQDGTYRITATVIEGKPDVGITTEPVRDRRLCSEPLFEDELLVVMRPGHLQRLLGQAHSCDLVGTLGPDGLPTSEQVDETLRPRIQKECRSSGPLKPHDLTRKGCSRPRNRRLMVTRVPRFRTTSQSP
jgi:hypothetical protein